MTNYIREVSMAHAALDQLGLRPSSREGEVPDLEKRIRQLAERTVDRIEPARGYEILRQRELKERDIATVTLSVSRALRVRDAIDIIEYELRKLRRRLVEELFL